jgi:hypothetical protein
VRHYANCIFTSARECLAKVSIIVRCCFLCLWTTSSLSSSPSQNAVTNGIPLAAASVVQSARLYRNVVFVLWMITADGIVLQNPYYHRRHYYLRRYLLVYCCVLLFYEIPFYLQSVQLQLANCVMLQRRVEERSVALLHI